MNSLVDLMRVERLLCLGAHCDDIEIGAGGTILRLLSEKPSLQVDWIVFSGTDRRHAEARACARAFLERTANPHVEVHGFRDGFFPFVGQQIKEAFEALKQRPAPDLVLTHFREDAHQDHRLINQFTWNTFRDHLIWEYEIPKYDGDLARPNFYVRLDGPTIRRKTDLLMRHYPTQTVKHWFTPETFQGLARLRGIECAAEYAEAFHCRKWAV